MIKKFLINSFQSKNAAVFLILLISLATNLLFFDPAKAPFMQPDSYGYVSMAKELSSFTLTDSATRTPTYPLYLAPFVAFNHLNWAIYGQIFISGITNVLIFLIAFRITKNILLSLCCALLVAVDFYLIDFQSQILTESLSSFLITLSLWLHLKFSIEKTSKKLIFLLIITDIALIFIRPVLVFLPGIMLLADGLIKNIFSKQRNISQLLKQPTIILLLCLQIFTVLWWCNQNRLRHNFFGISRLSDIALLGKLIQYDMLKNDPTNNTMPVSAQTIKSIAAKFRNTSTPTLLAIINAPMKETISFKEPKDAIKSILFQGNKFPPAKIALDYLIEDAHNTDPFLIYNELSARGFSPYNYLRESNSYFLKEKKLPFLIQTLRIMPRVILVPRTQGTLNPRITETFFFHFQIIFYLIISALSPIAVLSATSYLIYTWRKQPSKENLSLLLIIIPVWYVWFFVALLGYGSYNRLMMPVLPLIDMLVAFNIYAFIVFLKNRYFPQNNQIIIIK